MNRFLNGICILFVLLLLSCCGRREMSQLERQDSNEAYAVLAEIDSLMWQQPDSALAVLLDFAASPKADSLDVFDGHYFQLLVSELLYKNDYEQSNRPDLLRAVSYFDSLSLTVTDKPIKRHLIAGADPLSPTRSGDLVFLDARAHYINGVGYYERDSLVPACAEYIRALEIIETYFPHVEMVCTPSLPIPHLPRFMAYTYNRLGDMFSEQFMQESAIKCYENALIFCIIEPTSPIGVSNIYYRIGKQYDKIGEKHKANEYYTQAIEKMPSTNNLVFRDLVSTKALCDYQLGYGIEPSINTLKHIISYADNESEYLFRFLIIGGIYFEESLYDSALYYLEPVFESNKDVELQIQAANYLRIIYDRFGNEEKADACVHFLADYKNLDWEDKALISQLESLFKTYLDRKQEKQAKKEREKAVNTTMRIIIPVAIIVALVIIIIAKLRGRKLLKKQQMEADKVLGETEQQHKRELKQRQAETEKMLEDKEKQHQQEMESERQTRRMEQAALSGRLKRSNEKLRDVSKQLEETLARNSFLETEASDDYSAYINAPICLYIVNLVHKEQFKSKMDYLVYKDDALGKEQLLALRDAAEKHLARFNSQIRKRFPNLTDNDMDYCYLFLLGLGEADISALMQRAYTTVCDRSRKISRIIGASDSLYQTLCNMLYEN